MLIERNLAPTTFVAGPDDNLITDDVYAKADDSLVNALPKADFTFADSKSAEDLRGVFSAGKSSSTGGSLLGSFGTSATNFLSSIKSGISSLGGVANIARTVSTLTGPSILSRLGSGAGLTGIPGLSSDVSNTLSNVLRQTTGSFSNSMNSPITNTLGSFMSTGVGSSLTRIAPGNISTAMGVSSLISNLTGVANNVSVVDKDATSRLISSIASTGLQSGLNNSFSSISPLAGNNRDILLNAAGVVLKQVVSSGSIAGLKDVTGVLSGPAVRGINGGVLSGVASNYSLPSNSNRTVINYQYDEAKTTFASVDPTWNASTRVVKDSVTGLPKDETTVDITTLQNGSSDFLQMMESGALKSTDSNDKFMLLAGAFPGVAPEVSLKANFPTTITRNSSVTQFNTDRRNTDNAVLELQRVKIDGPAQYDSVNQDKYVT